MAVWLQVKVLSRGFHLWPRLNSCFVCVCLGLSFNGLHPRNPCNYIDYYSFTDPEGMEG